jgi:hypothetical protein
MWRCCHHAQLTCFVLPAVEPDDCRAHPSPFPVGHASGASLGVHVKQSAPRQSCACL